MSDPDRLDPFAPRVVSDELMTDRALQLIAALEQLIGALTTDTRNHRIAAKVEAQDRAAALWLLLTVDEEIQRGSDEQKA